MSVTYKFSKGLFYCLPWDCWHKGGAGGAPKGGEGPPGGKAPLEKGGRIVPPEFLVT